MKMQVPASPVVDPISAQIREETEQAYLRINDPYAAKRLWENWLTPKDRDRLGGDLEQSWCEHGKTVGMFMKARGVDRIEAIIHVAALLGFLRDQDRDRLLREWGLPTTSAANGQRPTWNPETGKLYWGGEIIRIVRLFKNKPSNLQVLIEDFVAENWPEVIRSPFQTPEQLHDTLRVLNKGLRRIKFFAVRGASTCRWELIRPKRRTR